ncbi:MAG: VOC family protein [Actinomycetota bacterium]
MKTAFKPSEKGVVLMLGDCPVVPMIPTRDRARARDFYENTMGLKMSRDQDEGMEFQSGGGTIWVYETYVNIPAEHTLAVWNVKDLDSEMEVLRSKGVQFEEYDFPELKTENGVATGGLGKACWFKDPDGNILSLIQEN